MERTNRAEINLIVYEYLREELKSKGFHWPLESPAVDESETLLSANQRRQVVEALCKLSHSISTSFNDSLNKMCLTIESEMTVSNLVELDYESFKAVADELFSQGYKWIHLICLLVFATKLIIFKINDSRSVELVRNVCVYLTDYLSQLSLVSWMNENRGWHGLLDYFESLSGSTKTMNSTSDSIASKLPALSKKLKFDCTIGFLGFALFGIFLFNKN